MAPIKKYMILVLAIGLTGCAGVNVVRLTDENYISAEGVRFYASQPYLFVTQVPPLPPKASDPTPPPTLEMKIIWLPKFDEQYAVSIHGGCGSVDANVQLEDGWELKSLAAKTDSQIPQMMNAISGLITAAAGAARSPGFAISREVTTIKPGLYRIVIQNGQVVKLKYVNIEDE
jgi:hypothetical protein